MTTANIAGPIARATNGPKATTVLLKMMTALLKTTTVNPNAKASNAFVTHRSGSKNMDQKYVNLALSESAIALEGMDAVRKM